MTLAPTQHEKNSGRTDAATAAAGTNSDVSAAAAELNLSAAGPAPGVCVESSAAPGAAGLVGVIPAMIRLRIVACCSCGCTFAIPAAMHCERASTGRRVCCPGCSMAIKLPSLADDDRARATQRALWDELCAAESRVAELTAELKAALKAARAPQPAPAVKPDRRELKRRCGLLASRAEFTSEGLGRRPICPVCGSAKDTVLDLRNHLRRQHAAEVAAMSASRFE